MEYSQFYEEYGHPFTGRKCRRLEEFLRRMNLSYDEGVQYTVNLVTQDGEIAATGSLQHNVIKCVAVDDRYQGEGLSSRTGRRSRWWTARRAKSPHNRSF